jgi:DNA-binding transcriptional LysR family regulator
MILPAGYDLHSIEVFTLTAELGSMTQCAQHLGTTQSAVSQTISKLEIALNVKLFDRTIRPMSLTASGKILFRDGLALVVAARGLIGDVLNTSERPVTSVTIAMAESMANLLTAPLLQALGNRSERWRIRSGISLSHHSAFLSRKIDMLITGSGNLEDVEQLERHPILEEEYVLIFPASYSGPVDPVEAIAQMPFIRYSMQSAMGQRTERQIARMRLQLAHSVEVDSTAQQITAVEMGLGWSMTTPLCLASHPALLANLRVEPMRQAQFRRQFSLVARKGEFGDLPKQIAEVSRRYLRDHSLVPLIQQLPWMDDMIHWS